MALNLSRRPIFPLYLSEENLVSPMRVANGYMVEGIAENNNMEVDACFDGGKDICSESLQDPVSKNILDVLPADPFGMDISSTFTAITGWLEDMEVGDGEGNIELFAGLNFIWSNKNNTLKFKVYPEMNGIVQKTNPMCSRNVTCCSDFGSSSCNDNPPAKCPEQDDIYSEVDGGGPHAALNFSLYYLGVQDLLSVGRVCRSLHSAVRGDPLLWMNIHVDQPLNEKINDDILLQLTNRALGNLQCLSLLECSRITDDGLKRVLDTNPRLTKLSVPGCTRLSIEGIVNNLRAFKMISTEGVKRLRIGGIYGATQEHFEELNFLLGSDCSSLVQENSYKSQFYQRGNFYVSCDDDRAIDIEICPRCKNLRLVYDCPADGCRRNRHATQACRACTLCILRCVQCGQCVNENEFVETFCLELLCSDCWKPSVKCEEKLDRMDESATFNLGEQGDGVYLHG